LVFWNSTAEFPIATSAVPPSVLLQFGVFIYPTTHIIIISHGCVILHVQITTFSCHQILMLSLSDSVAKATHGERRFGRYTLLFKPSYVNMHSLTDGIKSSRCFSFLNSFLH
jgi:hypothetical protein